MNPLRGVALSLALLLASTGAAASPALNETPYGRALALAFQQGRPAPPPPNGLPPAAATLYRNVCKIQKHPASAEEVAHIRELIRLVSVALHAPLSPAVARDYLTPRAQASGGAGPQVRAPARAPAPIVSALAAGTARYSNGAAFDNSRERSDAISAGAGSSRRPDPSIFRPAPVRVRAGPPPSPVARARAPEPSYFQQVIGWARSARPPAVVTAAVAATRRAWRDTSPMRQRAVAVVRTVADAPQAAGRYIGGKIRRDWKAEENRVQSADAALTRERANFTLRQVAAADWQGLKDGTRALGDFFEPRTKAERAYKTILPGGYLVARVAEPIVRDPLKYAAGTLHGMLNAIRQIDVSGGRCLETGSAHNCTMAGKGVIGFALAFVPAKRVLDVTRSASRVARTTPDADLPAAAQADGMTRRTAGGSAERASLENVGRDPGSYQALTGTTLSRVEELAKSGRLRLVDVQPGDGSTLRDLPVRLVPGRYYVAVRTKNGIVLTDYSLRHGGHRMLTRELGLPAPRKLDTPGTSVGGAIFYDDGVSVSGQALRYPNEQNAADLARTLKSMGFRILEKRAGPIHGPNSSTPSSFDARNMPIGI